jgi:hypothetical protein
MHLFRYFVRIPWTGTGSWQAFYLERTAQYRRMWIYVYASTGIRTHYRSVRKPRGHWICPKQTVTTQFTLRADLTGLLNEMTKENLLTLPVSLLGYGKKRVNYLVCPWRKVHPTPPPFTKKYLYLCYTNTILNLRYIICFCTEKIHHVICLVHIRTRHVATREHSCVSTT